MGKKGSKKRALVDSIAVGTFLGFVFSFLWFLWSINGVSLLTFKIYITAWIVFWMFMIILDFGKGSPLKTVFNMLKIMTSNDYTPQQKIAMCMSLIQSFLGIIADMQWIEGVKEPKKKKVNLKKIGKDMLEEIPDLPL